MNDNEESLSKRIHHLNNLLEEITEKEVDIQIDSGDLIILITNKNKQAIHIPDPDDVKLPEIDDSLYDLNDFIMSLPENGIC